jgi:hypothetical protein
VKYGNIDEASEFQHLLYQDSGPPYATLCAQSLLHALKRVRLHEKFTFSPTDVLKIPLILTFVFGVSLILACQAYITLSRVKYRLNNYEPKLLSNSVNYVWETYYFIFFSVIHFIVCRIPLVISFTAMTSQQSAAPEPVSVEITDAQVIALKALSPEIQLIPSDVFDGEANVRPKRDSVDGLRHPYEMYFVHKFNPSYLYDVQELGEVGYPSFIDHNINKLYSIL